MARSNFELIESRGCGYVIQYTCSSRVAHGYRVRNRAVRSDGAPTHSLQPAERRMGSGVSSQAEATMERTGKRRSASSAALERVACTVHLLLQIEKAEEEKIPPRDPKNPLCPGSTRAGGKVNSSSTSPVFLPSLPSPPSRAPPTPFRSIQSTTVLLFLKMIFQL